MAMLEAGEYLERMFNTNFASKHVREMLRKTGFRYAKPNDVEYCRPADAEAVLKKRLGVALGSRILTALYSDSLTNRPRGSLFALRGLAPRQTCKESQLGLHQRQHLRSLCSQRKSPPCMSRWIESEGHVHFLDTVREVKGTKNVIISTTVRSTMRRLSRDMSQS